MKIVLGILLIVVATLAWLCAMLAMMDVQPELAQEDVARLAERCVAVNMTWTPILDWRGRLIGVECNPEKPQ